MAKTMVSRDEFRRYWTAERLRAWLDYNPQTGEFTTRPRKIGTVQYFGKTRVPAETIRLKGPEGVWRQQYSHILAYLWMTGEWPPDEVDHVNTNSTDNRWSNLRAATHKQNNWNKSFASLTGASGLIGANLHKASGLWRATFRRRHLGYFKTAQEAHEAYKKAAIESYGEFAHSSVSERSPSSDPLEDDSSTRLAANEIESSESETN